MQHTRTLKKRQRRTLTKVNGQRFIPENENRDDIISRKQRQEFLHCNNRKDFTRLNLYSSEFTELRKKSAGTFSSRTRPTRNPTFHRNSDIAIDMEFGQSPQKMEFQYSRANSQLDINTNIEQNDRPYLFDKNTMSRLKQILLLGLTSGSFPWKWNKNTNRIDKISPILEKCWKIFRVLFLLQSFCLTLFQIYVLWKSASSGNLSNRELFMMSFNMVLYVLLQDFALNIYLYGDQIREYINTLLKFNFDMVNKYVINLDGYKEGGRMLVNFSIPGDFNAVLTITLYFLQMPYCPWFLFSYIYPKPWYWLIPGTIQSFWMMGQVIASHTFLYWIVAAHTNTIQFWLTEIHNNNDSDYTSDEIRERSASFEVLKSLRVLNNCFNECVSPWYIPAIKIHSAIVTIVLGYVTIRSMNHVFIEEFPQSLLFPMGAVMCSVSPFVMLKMSSGVYDLAISMVDSWSQTDDKNFRKTLISCPALRINVGRFYFITVPTTITFFKIVWDNIINVLLTFK